MQLDGTYEFLELSQQEGVMVSNARDKTSGKRIQVHLFPSEKTHEANEICRKLLSLPERVRRLVLKYGREGDSMYFVTEPLPVGEPLKKWVERQSGTQASPPVPGVGADTLGNLRQMSIEPAALRSVAMPPKNPSESADRAEISTPTVHSPPPEPRVRPMRPPEGPPVAGSFTRMYSREEITGSSPVLSSTGPEPPRPPAPAAADKVGFSQIYGKDAQGQPPTSGGAGTTYPEPEPPPATSKAGPGLDTFIGLPKPPQPAARVPATNPRSDIEQPTELGPRWPPREAAPILEMPPAPLPETLPAVPYPEAHSPPPLPSPRGATSPRRVAADPALLQGSQHSSAQRPETAPPHTPLSVQQPGPRNIDWVIAMVAMLVVLSLAGIVIWVVEHS